MSVYKPFLTSDIIVSPNVIHKEYVYVGANELVNSGINRYLGRNTPTDPYIPNSITTGDSALNDSYLIYRSVRELYYYNFLSGSEGSPINPLIFENDGTVTGQDYNPIGYNYPQSNTNVNRFFPTSSNSRVGV